MTAAEDVGCDHGPGHYVLNSDGPWDDRPSGTDWTCPETFSFFDCLADYGVLQARRAAELSKQVLDGRVLVVGWA